MNEQVNSDKNSSVFKRFLNYDKDEKGKENTLIIEKYRNKLGSGSDGTIFEVKVKGNNKLLAGKLISNINDKKKKD